ncbi:MAG TPA: DMT family transporter [Vicinamibacterales bacterium]|nr:DMT family transporter [Vicinamibacterales bacterium]
MRTVALTSAAFIGFAANSLLTRGALGTERLDAATFTFVRLLTGALTLLVLTRARPRADASSGSWESAAALAAYAICFTLAYRRIGAAVGALVLFGAVQATMIGTGLARGERPERIDWLGVACAIAGLLVFAIPGATAPDVLGTALMAAAGVCWGVYSLAGRAARDPLGATAGNFLRATLAGLVFFAAGFASRKITTSGLLLATASGSLASGVGYTLWYAALPSLAAWRAAIVQLIVPVFTALSAAALLGETITSRLVLATALVGLGVALTIHRK